MPASPDNFPLLAELLAEQQRLDTPVARFSEAHDRAVDLGTAEALARLAAPALIPLSAPGPGEQYAFEVDLDSCSGCKSCVAACHSLNGLDDGETWRDVGLLVGTSRRHPFTQTVTTACHHCADPACLNGCPVLAYEKDPITGIVRHLDDQCIGCSYCVLKCPYDVPKYSSRLGIVRKCDMCHGRLAHGEAPACAQACPTHAIRIVTVTVSGPAEPGAVAAEPAANTNQGFLPAAPDPAYTRPTTRYVTKRRLPAELMAGDAATLRIQPTHWPLVVLLTFMPAAVGCSVLGAVATALDLLRAATLSLVLWMSVVAGAVGLLGSVLHLGQPLRAWRVFLGLRRSWLSREAVLFGAWFPAAVAALVAQQGWFPVSTRAAQALAVVAATTGIAGLFSSVMIYVDTRRRFWRFRHTAPRFFGTAIVLASAALLVAVQSAVIAALVVVATVVKLLVESRALVPDRDEDLPEPDVKSSQLLTGPLRPANELRIGLALIGGLVIPALIVGGVQTIWAAAAAFLLLLAGELLERSLFFRAVDAPKMPGVPHHQPSR